MSQSPVTPAESQGPQLATYRDGWRRLVARISAGESFSGRERNCFFLNLGNPPAGKRFADLSAVSGFDFPEDARGIALTDWDHDGDLDFWISNRSSPAVRFLQNNMPGDHHHLQLRLVGTQCNRDAIGARVEVTLAGARPVPLLQTVRAGETYLSQSSRVLHFGLGKQEQIAAVTIRWPGQFDPQVVTGIAADRLYQITQGSDSAREITLPSATIPPPPDPEPADDSSSPRLVASSRPLFPPIRFDVPGTGSQPVLTPGQPTLLNLWASWCLACVDELTDWSSHAAELRAAGLEVVLVNADSLGGGGNDPDQAARVIRKGPVPFRWGSADRTAVEFVHEVVTNLTPGFRRPPVVPFSCLLDAQGQIAVVYRGPVEVAQVLADVSLLAMTPEELRHRLTPLPGRWVHPPLVPNSMPTAAALREEGFDAFAERYLRHILEVPGVEVPSALTSAQRGEAAFALGSLLASSGRWKESIPVNESAARLAPDDPRPRVNLGAAHSQLNEWQVAIDHYSAALTLAPGKGHVLVNRGNARLQLRQPDAALADFEAALALDPRDDQLRGRCALLHFQRGHDREALAHFQGLLQRHPDAPDVAGTTAWLLATTADDALRNGTEALRLATRWCEATNHADPNALNTLAAAQAELGQFDAAVQTVTQALRLARQQGLTALVPPLEERIKLYQSGKPFRR